MAIKSLQENNLSHSKIIFFMETEEESGSDSLA